MGTTYSSGFFLVFRGGNPSLTVRAQCNDLSSPTAPADLGRPYVDVLDLENELPEGCGPILGLLNYRFSGHAR